MASWIGDRVIGWSSAKTDPLLNVDADGGCERDPEIHFSLPVLWFIYRSV